MFDTVNWIGIILAGISNMVVGYIWYGPLFGKPWAKFIGMPKMDSAAAKKEMPKLYGMMFAATLVTAFVLQMLNVKTGSIGAVAGGMVGFWAWLGFVAPIKFGDVLWAKKPMNLYYIEAGYQLVALVVAGAILGIVR